MSGQIMEEKEVDLRDYLRVIIKRRHTVYTFLAVVFVIVVVGTFSTTPIYVASTKVLIDKAPSRAISDKFSFISYDYDPDFFATQYQLIKSSAVARKVVDALGMAKVNNNIPGSRPQGSSFLKKMTGGLSGLVSSIFRSKDLEGLKEKEDPDKRADNIARGISGGLNVVPLKNSKIVEISYMSPNPELARNIVNSIATAYIEELLDLNMSSTKYTLEWMTKQAEVERANVEKSEKALQEYVKAQNFVTLENKVAIIPQKISEISSKLISAESKKKELETLYNKVKEVSANLNEAENLSVISSDPTLQSLRQQILKSEQDITELSQKYGQKHPALLRAKEDLAGLKAKRMQEIRRVIESVKNEYELARSNENIYRRLLSETKGEALSLNEKANEYNIINREVETNRQLYDALLKRIKEQSITDKVQNVNVLIVEKAELPVAPVKPRKTMNLIMGLLFGLIGGVGMAFVIEYLDHTVKSPDEAELKLGVAVLGMVPLVNVQEKSIEAVVMKEPNSVIAESYKAIRTAILLSSADKPPKRLLITSTGPAEGKTATSINLAAAIAQSGYSVVLIDADLRRPRVHKVFGMNNVKGLSTYLAGASDMDVIQAGPIPNLSILPSGPVPPNPSELLGSKRMSEMINLLGEKYDIVICDSPPLLSVADSLVLDNILDATIIVTRAGKTTYEDVRKGLRSLTDLKAHVLGIIINALDVKKGNYYYYRYQNYYYSSEETPEKTKKAPSKKKA